MTRQVGRPDWSPEQVERGISAWLKLGSSEEAAKETGIPARTIRSWRALHPGRFADHCRRLARGLQAVREEVAQEAAEGIREAVLVVRRSLRGDAPIDPRDAAALLKALTTVDSSFDKIGRLDANAPTEIVEDRHSALLAKPGPLHPLAHRITQLLEDPHLAWKLRDTARHEAYSFFSRQRYCQSIQTVYEQLETGAPIEVPQLEATGGLRFAGRA